MRGSFCIHSVLFAWAATSAPAQPATSAPNEGDAREVVEFLAEETRDPLERVNRLTFGFNHSILYRVIAVPARWYRRGTPNALREGVDNFATNLTGPRRIINNLIQGEWGAAGSESRRFLVNTTVGVAGLFDPATDWLEMPLHNEDFGQSMGRWGVPPGPYLEAPFLGPSDPRDLVCGVVDMALNPLTYVPGANLIVRFNDQAMNLAEYESAINAVDDPYALFRNAFGLIREGEVRNFASTSTSALDVSAGEQQFTPRDHEVADSAAALENLPFTDRYTSSLAALMFEPEDINFFDRARDLHAPITSTGRELPFRLWKHRGNASPLLFLLPGLGGHPTNTGMIALAELFHNAGFDVVAIPSSFHADFCRTASTVSLPGHIEIDARDTRDAMIDIQQYLQRRYSYPPDMPALVVGESFGGLHALFISELDRQSDDPQFDGFLALNPPVNLGHGVRTLDSLFEASYIERRAGDDEPLLTSLLRVLGFVQQSEQPAAGVAVPLQPQDAMFGIGVYYRMKLSDVIFETQRRHDLGVLQTSLDSSRREERLYEIMGIGYEAYTREFIAPSFGGSDVEELFARGSLRAIQPGLAQNSRVRVTHNVNDFLLGPGDLTLLEETFRERLVLFSGGGHCGNYHLPEVQETFRNLAATLLESAPAP